MPRQARHEVDVGLWTGNDKRAEQIVDKVHDMKRLFFLDREELLGPKARFDQMLQAKLNDRLLRETAAKRHGWCIVCVRHAIWALNSKHNVKPTKDLRIDYYALPDPPHESTIVNDANWNFLNLPEGRELRKALLRVGTYARGEDSAQDIMREARRRMTPPMTWDAECPEPTAEWEIYVTNVEDLLNEAYVHDAFEFEMNMSRS